MLIHFTHVQLFVTPWIVACQAPLSMEFSRQQSWSGWPFISPGDLPNPGTEPASPALAGVLSCCYSLLAQKMFKMHHKFLNECIKIHLHGN